MFAGQSKAVLIILYYDMFDTVDVRSIIAQLPCHANSHRIVLFHD